MNCLQFAIRYKLKHKKAIIKIEHHLLLQLRSCGGFNRTFKKYLKFIGFKETILCILIPHFYILHDGHRYEGDFNCNVDYLKDLIENPSHLCETDLNDFVYFLEESY